MGGRSDVKGGMRVATTLAITCFLLLRNKVFVQPQPWPRLGSRTNVYRTGAGAGELERPACLTLRRIAFGTCIK
jgi:hypothetical protein